MLFLDCRHYIPGMESAHTDPSWLNRYPEVHDKIVGLVSLEHMGEMDYREVDGIVEPTGYAEQTYLWSRDNPILIDAAIAAVKSTDGHALSYLRPSAQASAAVSSRFGGA